jgi:hypothetical protein
MVPNPFYGIISTGALSGPEVPQLQLLLPFLNSRPLDSDERPVADSIYNAFQFRAEKRFSRGLQFLATYTFSKSIDDASVHSGDTSWLGGAVSLKIQINATWSADSRSSTFPTFSSSVMCTSSQ